MKALGIGGEADLDALVEAQGIFLDLLIAQQVEDIARRAAPTNAVAVKLVSARDRDRLRFAFAAVRHLDDLTRDLLLG